VFPDKSLQPTEMGAFAGRIPAFTVNGPETADGLPNVLITNVLIIRLSCGLTEA
jgi:hypothetical protein